MSLSALDTLDAELRRADAKMTAIGSARDFVSDLSEAGIDAGVEIFDGAAAFELVVTVRLGGAVKLLARPDPEPTPDPSNAPAPAPIPKQMPAPAPEDVMPSRRAEAVVDPDGFKRGPWSADEDRKVCEMFAAFLPGSKIAAALGRPVPATHWRIKVLKKDGKLPDREKGKAPRFPRAVAAKAPETAPAPAPAQLAVDVRWPTQAGCDASVPDAPAFTDARPDKWMAHLDAIADDDWCEAEDLEIIEGLGAGMGLNGVSARLNRDRDEIRARFDRLCPDKTLDTQAAVINALRLRIEAEGEDDD